MSSSLGALSGLTEILLCVFQNCNDIPDVIALASTLFFALRIVLLRFMGNYRLTHFKFKA
ncbi:hypothetical protein BP6252_04956 [Coleophoma cylindrospora]|uniref:Uncharacterized protein n=1 Tax=Coleophoma cylindrospora TaxID=1849047 RepID=A0A3D8S221_9HELO|nr:hypothetical protein BP6252_04956 [Coleophoma cylindrospora]